VAKVLEAVLVVLLTVHLLLVDVAMVGPLASVWLDWRSGRTGDAAMEHAGLTVARLSSSGLTLGIALGVVLLGARWQMNNGTTMEAAAALPRSRLWFAGFELLFYFACMGAYTGLWRRWRRWRLAHRLLAVAAASNLLMHFPALFVIISVVGQRPELLSESVDSAEFRRLLVDGEVLSRVVHVWLAAVAVTAVVLMALGLRMTTEESQRESGLRLIRGGALLGLVATLVQVPVGFWVTLRLPESARSPLMGGDLFATGLFLTSIGLALALLHQLAAIALGDVEARPIRRAMVVLVVLMLLMVGTRRRADQQLPLGHAAPPESVAGF
jgi:hypothetical protein